MARRSNFLEGNDNFREQNLRFVRNEFEDNINQFFGGANPGGGSGSNQQKPPPRDSLIVQPTPGRGPPPDHLDPGPGRNLELDSRRQFIRELGASRMTAHALAVRTFKVPNFNLRYYQRQRFRLSVELGDSRQDVVDSEVLRAIGESVQNMEPDLESRPRTPSPPRNIDWHNVDNRDDSPVRSDNRSRPRNRQDADDFRGDNSREFVDQQEREREPFNRNTAPNNRYNRNPNSDNRNANLDEFNRNNRNANQQDNRYNRNANTQEFNRYNRNSDEFNRNNRNSNPQQEFQRGNYNANPQNKMNQNIRNENPEMNRNNRNMNPQALNRNQNPQEVYRNNRNPNNDEFYQNNRNDNRNNRNVNPQEFNRNVNPQGNRNTQSITREMPLNINRNANPEGNRNFRAAQLTSRETQQHFNNPQRFNNNNNNNINRGPGNTDFVRNQQGNPDRNPMIDQRRDIDDNFLEPRDRQQQHQQTSDFRQLQHNEAENSGPPQIGRNYQRIVNDNRITICRPDWIETNRGGLDNRNPNFRGQRSRQLEDQDLAYTDDPIMEDDDGIRRPQQQQDNFRRPGFRGPEVRNFEGNQGNARNQSNNDANFHGRGRNDRNDRRQFNDDNYENDRARSNDSDTFQDSNNADVSPNRYRRNIDRYHGDQRPNANRTNQGRNAPNSRDGTTSRDRSVARSNMSGRGPRFSQDRNLAKNSSTGGPQSIPDRNRSTSLASQSRSSTGGQKPIQDRNASRSVKPGNADLKKPTGSGPSKPKDVKSGVPPITKPKRSPSEAKNSKPNASKASTSNQAKNNEPKTMPRPGQKRKAETTESETKTSSNQTSKVDNKRKKIKAPQPEFIIGGFRMPYINNNKVKLPQAEEMSYAVTFFEQTPIYNTNEYAIDSGQVDDAVEEVESEAESFDSTASDSVSRMKKIRSYMKMSEQMKEWADMYKKKNYKDWYMWWKDYKRCGNEINKKLEEFGDLSVRHRFIPKYPTTEDMISKTLKGGHKGLMQNNFTHYRNIRSIFLLMNETFLKALSVEEQEKLQDLIRGIPNHLWLYKVRSMVYLWDKYHRFVKTLGESKMEKKKELKQALREWRNPLFHWLAKQTFEELKAISGISWPEHQEIFPDIV